MPWERRQGRVRVLPVEESDYKSGLSGFGIANPEELRIVLNYAVKTAKIKTPVTA